jgi:hypothetical protein
MKNLLIIASFLLIGVSCKKKPIKGCTISSAENYNSSATEDDGSCRYKGSLIVWTKPPCSNVNLYMDGAYKGELTATSNTSPQNCTSSGAFKIYMEWTGGASKTYRFKGETNINSCATGLTWEADVVLEGNKCRYQELK